MSTELQARADMVAFAPTPLIARTETERILLEGLHADPTRFHHPDDLYGQRRLTRHVHETLARWVEQGVIDERPLNEWITSYRIRPEYIDPVLIRRALIAEGDQLRRVGEIVDGRRRRTQAQLDAAMAQLQELRAPEGRAGRQMILRALREVETVLGTFRSVEHSEEAQATRHTAWRTQVAEWGFDPDAVWVGAMSDDDVDPMGADA